MSMNKIGKRGTTILKDLTSGQIAYVPHSKTYVMCVDAPQGDIYLELKDGVLAWYYTSTMSGYLSCRLLGKDESVTIEFKN